MKYKRFSFSSSSSGESESSDRGLLGIRLEVHRPTHIVSKNVIQLTLAEDAVAVVVFQIRDRLEMIKTLEIFQGVSAVNFRLFFVLGMQPEGEYEGSYR